MEAQHDMKEMFMKEMFMKEMFIVAR